MKKYLFSGLFISTALISTSAFAGDYTAGTKVNAATIYRNGGALVSRATTFDLPVGIHTISFPMLPESADENYSPFINILKGSAQINSVKFREVYSANTTSDVQKKIEAKIKIARNQILEENKLIETSHLQMNFLRTLGNSSPQQGTALSVSDWQTAFQFIGDKGEGLLEKISASKNKVSKLNDEIKALQRELKAAGSKQIDTMTGIATIELDSPQTIELAVNYFMEDAGWELEVSSSLNTESDEITITDKASIHQQTGENWQDITLSLSNNDSFGDFGSVEQRPLFLNLLKDERFKTYEPARTERRLIQADGLEEVVVTGSRITTNNSLFDRSYSIKGAYSQNSSADSEEILISRNSTRTQTVIRALPRESSTAYVFAEAQFEELETQRNTQASLYRDGHFIGKDDWPDLIKGKRLKLPFGADQQIKITYQEQPPKDDKRGVFSKSNIEEKRYLISVINEHNSPQIIEIYDRMPVSGHDDIKVTTIKGATPPADQNMDNKQGLLMWRKTLEPGETWEIKHQYRITYPADQRLGRR
ncbi:mucoidy inhibitor MuiA family protein [Kordiimonas sp. SCSIO 12603]|uniref:mucoidy inhibitor MuiA family protein n=1 Tax=Kordiimonas sp. SCSIO 12603 TaxID=2829596 RepID=UPI002103041C|nr:mucoidy inhibitor MuiA family protein [Kordiimonas sp. SCSIO 12603]UTW57284.1 mucoidy inhibitor MuiA family protein [Kordiimonas sp. SCSIO 12603]